MTLINRICLSLHKINVCLSYFCVWTRSTWCASNSNEETICFNVITTNAKFLRKLLQSIHIKWESCITRIFHCCTRYFRVKLTSKPFPQRNISFISNLFIYKKMELLKSCFIRLYLVKSQTFEILKPIMTHKFIIEIPSTRTTVI